MTEEEWLHATDPQPMLAFLKGKASDRKLRLFAVACCRSVWNLLAEESRHAALVAERVADGLANADKLTAARHHATRPARDALAQRIRRFPGAAGKAAAALVGSDAYDRVHAAYGEHGRKDAPQHTARELGLSAQAVQDPRDAYLEAEAHAVAAQTALIRDVLGNPFRPVTLDPAWLSWNDGTIPKLAQAIYEERAFDRLPILADALEEVGCTDQDMLAHCRSGGEHVRGCWVIDALLGKS
jgi:hypothetical protein